MYSQDPVVRRRKVKFRFFSYGVMTVATVALATIGIYYILGYRFDNSSFELERGGLVKFDSRPQGADVTVDGQRIEQTPYQVNLTAGEHDVSYSREGYQGWQKKVNLRPGEVLWLNYARLIPTSITTSPIRQLSAIYQTSASPSREWYLLHETAGSPLFRLMDLRDESNVNETLLRIPSSAFTSTPEGGAATFEIVEWNIDSNFILVRHRTGKQTEFIRVPRDNPLESVNLSRLFKLDLRSVQFASNTENVLFATDAGQTLYRLDLNDAERPITIAENVAGFDNLDESKVAFVNTAGLPGGDTTEKAPQDRSLKIWQRNGESTAELRPVPPDVPVFVSYNPYLTRDYVSLVFENSISVIENPLSGTKKTVVSEPLAFTPTLLNASPGNRFFLTQRGENVYVYDIELGQGYNFTASGQGGGSPMQWADDHHVAFSRGNNLRVAEFDGKNMQFITSTAGQYDVVIGADGEVLLSIGRSVGGNSMPVLQQSYLLSEKDRQR